ncbi:MAG TPA: hypothetical protein VFA79_01840 [Myxococcales bacterium]|nr:hypothetical protein [Myxococcales bacterium]
MPAKKGIAADVQHLLRIVLRALREARKGNRRTLIDKLTAMNIYLQLMIRRLTREPARRRKRQTRRK